MYTKEHLIRAMKNEFRIIKHLAEKVPADMEGYKPTEKQRTTLELLQYISILFVAFVETVKQNDVKAFGSFGERSKGTTLANFPQCMDVQEQEVVAALEAFTDEDLQTIINLYGQGDNTKAAYLVESLLKWAAAYKMQLFLYIKASGNSAIGTSNLWGGMDMPAA